MFRSSTAAKLHASALGAILAHKVHPEKRGVAHVHASSVEQIAQHAAPCAFARGGRVALQPAVVSNKRVAQENSFRECGVAQSRQQAVGGGGVKSASAGGACMRRNCMGEIREGALGERLGEKGILWEQTEVGGCKKCKDAVCV